MKRRPLAWRRLWIGPLVVLAVIGSIVVVLNVLPLGHRWPAPDPHRNTRMRLDDYSVLAQIFHDRRGRPPESIADLVSTALEISPPELSDRDDWGTRIRFLRTDARASEFEVRSAGPNRIMDDSDDLFQRFVVPPPDRK